MTGTLMTATCTSICVDAAMDDVVGFDSYWCGGVHKIYVHVLRGQSPSQGERLLLYDTGVCVYIMFMNVCVTE